MLLPRIDETAIIEDYLEWVCTTIELMRGSTTRSEVDECLNIWTRWINYPIEVTYTSSHLIVH